MFVDTLRLLKRMPGLFIPGVLIAVLDAIQIWFSLTGETFIAPRLLAVELVLMPFAFAAVYGAIKADDASFKSLIREGSRNYFRVLLPGLLVAFGAVAIAVVATGLMMALVQTDSVGLVALVMMLVIAVFALLTLFYDTAAVFEEQSVFNAIRRSVAVVSRVPMAAVRFLFAAILVALGIGVPLLVIWTAALYQQLTPIATMTPVEAAAFTQDQLFALIGSNGAMITTGLYFVGFLFFFTLMTTYKALLFKEVAAEEVSAEPQGEYDEKGRYYRY
ncbi:DUF7847 domain-containing protein [Methanosphaerula palustris]|uniref:Uncharacterized protein n=1 Tax=Methanosphaerula palustris (strain ATCC BAA-1556 / DSM 19958 / E1-9c) TaxID=521011 RepID=B8GDM2_METPE|nr:hypothetical protein [Methanosphaerula palustris]ACL17373.1 conserved hypothetical protein [Methanosphaerula palustris E1-9c]